MKGTREEIINIANTLIRSVGYNAFSYTDISKKLDIKNAAIHYHFPSKADLGVEVIKKNLDAFLRITDSWKELGYKQQLTEYITMHNGIIKKRLTCVVGSLSPSFDTLPPSMQKELHNLIETIISWLSDLLRKGRENGELSFNETPEEKAYTIHSALLSALLMNKVLQNNVYQSVQNSLLKI
ncbi:MAG: TetR/AcrR family transcriptional regulator [Tannerella sp.]|jgi:AcrR family transcriptional regulator|nr:TetR/AcrR family transcriptional regulator [Tannerella sp.]